MKKLILLPITLLLLSTASNAKDKQDECDTAIGLLTIYKSKDVATALHYEMLENNTAEGSIKDWQKLQNNFPSHLCKSPELVELGKSMKDKKDKTCSADADLSQISNGFGESIESDLSTLENNLNDLANLNNPACGSKEKEFKEWISKSLNKIGKNNKYNCEQNLKVLDDYWKKKNKLIMECAEVCEIAMEDGLCPNSLVRDKKNNKDKTKISTNISNPKKKFEESPKKRAIPQTVKI